MILDAIKIITYFNPKRGIYLSDSILKRKIRKIKQYKQQCGIFLQLMFI